MDPGFRSPLIDFFRRGEVMRDVRLLAAQGALAPRAQEQIALLVLLSDDPDPELKMLSSLPVLDRMKLAMKGTREQRAQLIRDSNKLVSAAVLSSPKVNEAEIEAFTKMGTCSEDVMRIIGQNKAWTKNYGIILGLCKHPKAPPA